jgi:hypothetical protein
VSTYRVVVQNTGVWFSIDHQTFQLHIEDDPDQLKQERYEWFARQLTVALKRLEEENLTNLYLRARVSELEANLERWGVPPSSDVAESSVPTTGLYREPQMDAPPHISEVMHGARGRPNFVPGDVYQVDESDPNSLAKIVEQPSPGTVRMEFIRDNSWGKSGKKFAMHPAFVKRKIALRKTYEELEAENAHLAERLSATEVQLARLAAATESDPPAWYRLLKAVQAMTDEEWAAFLKNPPKVR